MAIIKLGILGPLHGKVGPIIGTTWKDVAVIKAQAQSYNDRQSQAQLTQRMNMKLTMLFLRPLKEFIRIGYKDYEKNMSAFNAATSQILKNAIVGSYPEISVNCSRALLSKGILTPVFEAFADHDNGMITIKWNDNSNINLAKPTDVAMPVAYNLTKSKAIFKADVECCRSDERLDITFPSDWKTDTVAIYLSFIDLWCDRISNSVFVDTIILS